MTKLDLMPPAQVKALTVMSATEFDSRLTGEPGEQFTYHRGLLMRDKKYSTVLRSIAAAAWAAWIDGRAHLAQRRIAPGVCEYIAEIKPRPKPRHFALR